jgi:isoquinoline 1-oxidoreductase beta subunit
MSNININRRQFLKTSCIGAGMLLSIQMPIFASNSKVKSVSENWCLYVHINPDNSVIIYSPVVEMGQHMKTTGPMILAEEMDIDWNLVTIADDCPTYLHRDSKGTIGYKYSDMRSGGSHAVRNNWDYMRNAGAAVKQMMLEEAAVIWKVKKSLLKTRDSYVLNSQTGQSISYGVLAKGAARRQVDVTNLTLKFPSEYRIMGKDKRTVDINKIVTGSPLYGIDSDYPNLVQVIIDRAPWQGASVDSFNQSAAMSVPGVIEVIKIDRQVDHLGEPSEKQIISAGVAIVAKTLWAVIKAKRLLNTQWKQDADYLNQSSREQQVDFRKQVQNNTDGKIRKNDGDVITALKDSDIVLDHSYETPLFMHACMEPHNCIADIREHDATIIIGHQFPHLVAEEVEQFTEIDGLNVEIINRRIGGGFGRRYERDFVREAILVSKRLKRPVKITWMREDEMERDFFAPANVMRIQAGLDSTNKITAWHHKQAQTSGGPRDNCFPAHLIKNYRTETVDSHSKIPTGPWRGPGHLQWTFAVESMTDELAHQAKQDPLAFRLNMLLPHKEYDYVGYGAKIIDSGRMASCYKSAAKLAGWGRKLKAGHGLGIAGHFTFGSYSAFVVEVSVNEQNKLTLHKAWGAIDCGFAINPNHIRNQMEGGFIEGLNAALFNRAEIEKGRLMNNNFHALRWIKMREAPKEIDVVIIENDYPPTGVGEPPTAPAAAALTNAIFAASGKRLRSLPLIDHLTI